MKLKYFNLLILFAVIILGYLSLIFGKFGLLVVFLFFVLVVTTIFGNTNYNNKYFYSGIIILFSSLTAYLILTPYYDKTITLGENFSYIFPIAGAMLVAVAIDRYLSLAILRRKSFYLIGRNKYQESLDNSNKILKSYTDDYGGLFFKGMALERLGRHNEQLEIVNILIEKREKKWFNSSKLDDVALNELTMKIDALLHLNRYDEASDIIESTLKRKLKTKHANQGYVLFFKGKLLSKLGNYPEAIHYYDKSFPLIYESIDNFSKSKEYKRNKIDELVSKDQGLDENWVDRGKAHEQLQQYQEALDSYYKALSINPESEEALKRKDDVLDIISGKDVVSG